MALTAQTRSLEIGRELSYTIEKILLPIKRNAFLHSPATSIFLGDDIDDLFGPGPMRASAKDTQEGGQKILVHHELGKSENTQNLASGWATFSTAPTDPVRITEAEWKHYSDAVTVSDSEVLINRGSSRLADIVESQTRNAVSSLLDLATDHIYEGTGTQCTGLTSLINANNTIQGLSGADYTQFNSWGVSGKDTAAASVSFASGSFAVQGVADIRDAFTAATYGMMKPTCGLTTEDIYNFYEGSLVPNQEYSAPTSRGDSGFESLAYRRSPIYPDPKCTSGALFWVDTECLRSVVLAGADMEQQEPRRALNQEATTIQIQLKFNLVSLDRRRNNKLTGITA